MANIPRYIIVAVAAVAVLFFGSSALLFFVGPLGTRFSTAQLNAWWAFWTAVGTLALGVGAVVIAYFESERARAQQREAQARTDAARADDLAADRRMLIAQMGGRSSGPHGTDQRFVYGNPTDVTWLDGAFIVLVRPGKGFARAKVDDGSSTWCLATGHDLPDPAEFVVTRHRLRHMPARSENRIILKNAEPIAGFLWFQDPRDNRYHATSITNLPDPTQPDWTPPGSKDT